MLGSQWADLTVLIMSSNSDLMASSSGQALQFSPTCPSVTSKRKRQSQTVAAGTIYPVEISNSAAWPRDAHGRHFSSPPPPRCTVPLLLHPTAHAAHESPLVVTARWKKEDGLQWSSMTTRDARDRPNATDGWRSFQWHGTGPDFLRLSPCRRQSPSQVPSLLFCSN